MSNEYKYNDVTVRFYDVVYETLTSKESIEFYLNQISNTKGSTLEVGVGTGRIFIPALDNGDDVYGIDQSPLMLNKLKEKLSKENYFRLYENDMRSFKLDKKFKLIIAPFRVFQHLLTIEDQLKALNNIYDHLEEGGRLIFDVFNPDLKRIITPVYDGTDFDGEYEPGRKLKRLATIVPINLNQILNITFKFIWDEDGEEKKDEYFFPMRYYFRFELENLIGRTKFKLETIYGNFDMSEIGNQPKEFIVVCSK